MKPAVVIAQGFVNALSKLLELPNPPKVFETEKGGGYLPDKNLIAISFSYDIDFVLKRLANEVLNNSEKILQACRKEACNYPKFLIYAPVCFYKFLREVKNVITEASQYVGSYIITALGLGETINELTYLARYSFAGIVHSLSGKMRELAEESLKTVLESVEEHRKIVAEELAETIRDTLRLCMSKQQAQQLGLNVEIPLLGDYVCPCYILALAVKENNVEHATSAFVVALRVACPTGLIYRLAEKSLELVKRICALALWASALNAPEKIDDLVAIFQKIRNIEHELLNRLGERVRMFESMCVFF